MTRPLVLLDLANSRVHLFASDESGGSVYTKSSSLSSITFPTGLGTLVMHDDSHQDINNVTSTKQNLSAGSGLLVLASNDTTDRYWHHYDSLGSTPSGPTASFTANPSSGDAPLAVTFTDTSTGGPTSWSWDFTDDGTVDATTQNAAHTYTAAGTYTARLTVSNTNGTSSTTRTVTVSEPGGGGTQTFAPSDDTYANSSSPTQVNGNTNNLRVRAGSTNLHTYLRFTVSGVGSISDARVRLWVLEPGVDGGGLQQTTTTAWSEGSLNWTNRPAPTGPVLDTAGAAATGTWVELDVSAVVTGDGTYSFVLINGANDLVRYASSEASNAAQRPQLVVTTP
jgi:PKD repeat protein